MTTANGKKQYQVSVEIDEETARELLIARETNDAKLARLFAPFVLRDVRLEAGARTHLPSASRSREPVHSRYIPRGAPQMALHDWLLSERLATHQQYAQIVRQIFDNSRGSLRTDRTHLLVSPYREPVLRPTELRRDPVGEVIDSLKPLAQDVYRNAGVANLQELVAKWQRWHVDNLEPIVAYPTGTEFASRLYEEHAVEKKLVAWFLTNVPVRGEPLIRDTDNVVIPDGSSGFYVGLAIAAWKNRVCLISSNGPLFCEYLCNPAFSNALEDFYLIGGKADHRAPHDAPAGPAYKACQNGGMFDEPAHQAYEKGIMKNPQATVVVMPVSGILPEEGPYGLEDQTRQLNRSIIDSSVKQRVRQLVFIADHSKHREDDRSKYGLPIMNTPGDWHAFLDEHHDRISLVTASPPAMRDLLHGADPIHPAERPTIQMLKSGADALATLCDYNRVACEFGKLFQDASGRPNFHEVESLSAECWERASLVSEVASPNPHYLKSRTHVTDSH